MSSWRALFLVILLSLGMSGCSLLFSSKTEPVSRKIYVVKSGDTLGAIARTFDTTVDELVRFNQITNPNFITPGMELTVAGSQSSPREQLSPSQAQLVWPVGKSGGELVSKFGPRGGAFHDGLDIAAVPGTPVLASHEGVVAYSSNDLGGYGEVIILKSTTSSVASVYAHNSRRFVREGELVRKGQQIALVGATGRAEGPHLHFEVRVKDPAGRYVAVDPLPLLRGVPKPTLRYRVNESLSPIIARLKSAKLIN
jgi:murein DD-endopeptidase MepM/ murein hydrolase activator NlpD